MAKGKVPPGLARYQAAKKAGKAAPAKKRRKRKSAPKKA